MKIDIIIPTCKAEGDIQELLAEIARTTYEPHRVIATCQPASASINRNIGLDASETPIVVMMDDDVTGFPNGWLTRLITPMLENNKILLISAYVKNADGKHQMGMKSDCKDPVFPVQKNRVTTAFIAIRRSDLRFDENYIGSGYEDTDFCNQIYNTFGVNRIWVNRSINVIHMNEMKQQGGKNWQHNHDYYMSKWNDPAVKDQKDWTK